MKTNPSHNWHGFVCFVNNKYVYNFEHMSKKLWLFVIAIIYIM